MMTPMGAFDGRAAIEAMYRGLFESYLPRGETDFRPQKPLICGEVALILWEADSPAVRICGAVETFVVRAGRIVAQIGAGDMQLVEANR
jgi:hypothetical protein